MPDEKPRLSADPMYLLIREGRVEEFNRRKAAGEKYELRGANLRGLDLRELDVAGGIDFSNAYLRQADLRGLNLAKCRLEGASLHAAHVSGVLFPVELEPAEIEMSVRIGTRLRYRP
ncbi:MAG TPA: pentapeptide repeat-containing protein [Steroidobacteraceae bacterium]|nr:pentapeptide repeat-containing protein [Steroidobacteraceae bacterium]